MTKKQRRIIFYTCVLIFIILAPIIILYSFGWRIDFKNLKLLPSGALYLKTNQSGIKLYLDNKFKKRSTNLPIFNSFFIKNLAPRAYNIRVEKDGYLPWEKTLKIEPELVTEAENIILIPKNLTPEIISTNILKNKDFIISKNNKNIFWLSLTSDTSTNNFLELNSFNLESSFLSLAPSTSTKKIIFPNPKILKSINLIDISWNNNDFLLKTDNNTWFLYNNKKNKLINLNKILEKILPQLINIEFYPYKNSLLIFTYNNLYEMNLENQIVSLKLTDILYYKIFKDYIYFINNKYNLSKLSIYDNKIENIISIKELVKTKIPVFNLEINDNNKFALNINSSLYLIDGKNKTIKLIKDGVILTKFSNDNKKLALTTKDNDLFIYYLENITNRQPFRFSEQIDKINTLNETPTNIFWYPKDEHMYLQSDNQLIFTEIDNRGKTNYYSIINENIKNSYFNNSDNYIYLNIDSKILRIKIK